MKLVLLPGMDGTGELFSPFLDVWPGTAAVVRYPGREPLAYDALEQHARAALPSGEPFALLGESFSGPIALSIAASPPANLAGLILSCSFARNPQPLLGRLRFLVNHLPSRPPLRLLETVLCGGFTAPRLRALLAESLGQVSPAVMRARLRAVCDVDVLPSVARISVPTLYLQGSEDRVVPASAAALLHAYGLRMKLVTLHAPHFLLQAAPREAAGAILRFGAALALNPPGYPPP